jgi:hypothetical protein
MRSDLVSPKSSRQRHGGVPNEEYAEKYSHLTWPQTKFSGHDRSNYGQIYPIQVSYEEH